ncbi:hypothetical protein MATL_G00238410 [Megalops atlanticus]|uniref:Uncharacterized protein n=1 Tax=Megalops atlanticus TaxID=7932 RepID=A0A9D3PG86_MEGAT|nr:hypothetical protein MATL_G00238410 [Megalops atlanticus]
MYGPAQLSLGVKVDYRSDLLAIRFASFNPILDPWVYILCRKNLLVKGCETVKRTVGIVREGHRRKEGWVSGPQTPPSYANSNTTSYASLRTANYDRDSGNQIVSRTKSFTDFTQQQHWDFESARPSFHPFSVEAPTAICFEKLLPMRSKLSEGTPDLCAILQESPALSGDRDAQPTACVQALPTHEKQVEIVTCTFSTPTSCTSERCL